MKKYFIWFLLLVLSGQSFALYTDGTTIPHKITTYDPDRRPIAVAGGVDYFTDFVVNVEGVLLRVQTPGNTTNDRYVRITAYYGDTTNEIVYEYYPENRSVKMKIGEHVVAYDENNNKEMTFIVVDRVKDLLAAAYAEVGLDYDPETRQLAIDKNKYLAKADPQIDIRVENQDNKISLIVTKAGQTATVSYNFDTETIEKPNDLTFAGGYEWDVANNGVLMAVNLPPAVAASGISASSIDWLGEVGDIVSLPLNLAESLYNVSRDYIALQRMANVKTQPQKRLAEPEIIDVSWIDRQKGVVRIEGGGSNSDADLEIYITRNGQTKKLNSGVSGSPASWIAINNLEPLADGVNKINAIVRGSGNREVESGDITVYKGAAGEPDLILLSPRDRQVFGSQNFPFEIVGFEIIGKTSPNATLNLLGQQLVADQIGEIREKVNVRNIVEGVNTASLELNNNIVCKVDFVGAFKFVNDYKPYAYLIRKADFLFNGVTGPEPGLNLFPIPYDPNHTGIYTGGRNVTEAIYNEIVLRPLITTDDWLNDAFATATQVPKIISESNRSKVVDLVLYYKNSTLPKYEYDVPVNVGEKKEKVYSLVGHYDGPANGKFYCSELAYWTWEQTALSNGFDFGIIRKDTMFPELGIDDPSKCSVLPAFFYKMSMENKQVAKN